MKRGLWGARVERIGAIEYRDHATTLHACLAAYLRLCGRTASLEQMLGWRPVAATGVHGRDLRAFARHAGLRYQAADPARLSRLRDGTTILARMASHYWFLLWPAGGDQLAMQAALPGVAGGYRRVDPDADLLQLVAAAYILDMPASARAPAVSARPPRFWALSGQFAQRAHYDRAQVQQLERAQERQQLQVGPPGPLRALTAAALCQSHRAMCHAHPAYYGRYRSVNLRRGGTVFIDWPRIGAALDALLGLAREHRAANAGDALAFAATLFADFVSIHPFLDGNHRMAIRVVGLYLAPWGIEIDWPSIHSTQHYYWMRCAQRGHLSILEHGLRSHQIARVDAEGVAEK